MKSTANGLFFIGLALYAAYILMNRFVVDIPDVLAYPWIIVSCICMLTGIYGVGKRLGEHFRNR